MPIASIRFFSEVSDYGASAFERYETALKVRFHPHNGWDQRAAANNLNSV